MKSLVQASVSVLVVSLSACTPTPERSYSTEKFELHTDFSAPLCGGDLDRWTSFVEHVEDSLEVEVAHGLDVYLWDEADWTSGPWCSQGASGCYAPGRHDIFAVFTSVEHELVHAVAESLGSRNVFFSEGVATAFESEPTRFGWSAPLDNIGLGTRAVDRATAGHFVRWLWETRARELLIELLASKADAAAFEEIYGQSLEQAQAQYWAEAPWSYPPFFVHDLPSLAAFANDYWEEVVAFDCGSVDVYGRPGGAAAIRRLEVTVAGTYALWTDADGVSVSQRQRGIVSDMAGAEALTHGDVPLDFVVWYAGGTFHEIELTVGEYELWITDLDADSTEALFAMWDDLGPTPVLPEGAG